MSILEMSSEKKALLTLHSQPWLLPCQRVRLRICRSPAPASSHVVGVLSALLQRHFMQTGERRLTQTLADVSWTDGGGERRGKLGASHPAAPRRRHIKERSWGGLRTGFSPDNSPKCAFVDYRLVFPRRNATHVESWQKPRQGFSPSQSDLSQLFSDQ